MAIAGAPASGKTTLAEELAVELTELNHPMRVLPKDGFHLDNAMLSRASILNKKLRTRLIQRWLDHGLSRSDAKKTHHRERFA